MIKAQAAPNTLSEAIRFFQDPDSALHFLVQLRWPNGVACPRCGHPEVSFLKTRRIWKCKGCKQQFSVKVGTIFEDSPLGLDKWLPALWMLANAKNGISSYEVHRALGVTQKTAWFMLHRIRLAMQAKGFEPFSGDVEIDETFVGGLAKFMHKKRKERVIKGTGGMNKTAVVGALKRGKKGTSRIAAAVVPNVRKHHLEEHIAKHVEEGSNVYTDQSPSYHRLRGKYVHEVINHAVEYARGAVHTNGLENFWSLFKRSVKGTYVSLDPFHVHAYVTEQAFRFNEREGKDGDRFKSVLRGIVDKRLTYKDLIGADMAPATT